MDPPLPTNPQWKKYQTQIDRSLQSFESIKEWADFISFLSKLLKTFQAFPAFTEIPRKLTIAKRLAQCLTPALPSGVHQRALDVYAYILDVIGVCSSLSLCSCYVRPTDRSTGLSLKG